MTRILVTGALGQIGSELTTLLAGRYGKSSVVASDIREPREPASGIEYVRLDVTDGEAIRRVLKEQDITDVFHLAAILSAAGERDPGRTFLVNSTGTYNILEESLRHGTGKVVIPSTIGVFGPETPRDSTPDITITRPTTMYGITKVNAEMLSLYYRDRLGLDVRGLRFPGIISYLTPPSAGTTDYAVDMFYHAVRHRDYECYLKEDTALPMMYMPDALNSLVRLFEADGSRLQHCLEYNVSAYSFTPAELHGAIRAHFPEFRVTYRPDYRQAIADSWPMSLDTTFARKDWDFSPEFSLEATVSDMISNLKRILAVA